MTCWRTICLIGLAAALLCGLTPTQGKPKAKSAASFASLPYIDKEDIRKMLGSLALSDQGDACVRHLAWKEAERDYKQALGVWSDNQAALYGLAKCSQAAGDKAKAIEYFRRAVYSDNPAGKGFRENNADKLMEFALLLAQTAQPDEAVYVYHHAAAGLNYMDDKPHLKVMLPAFGDAEWQVPYSPQALQAMAHVGIAIYSQDENEKLANLNEAIRLQPDMPQAYYYKGQTLWVKPGRSREALAAYQKARLFAGIDTQLQIDQVIKENDLEKAAALEQMREKQKAVPNK